MLKLINHPRFWLFAPFVGLIALTLVTFGFWHYAAKRIGDEMAAQGLSWQSLSRSGFPARITLDMQAPRFRTGDLNGDLPGDLHGDLPGDLPGDWQWQNDRLTATLMPFSARHAVVDFIGAHHFTHGNAEMILAHNGNLASAVFDLAGLLRGSFEAQNPRLSGGWRHIPLDLTADSLGLHTKRADKTGHYQLAVVLKNLNGLGDRLIERLDMTADVPQHMLSGATRAGDKVQLDRLTLERNGLTLVARGQVKLADDGYLHGSLDLDLVDVDALISTLEEFGLTQAHDRTKWLFFGGLGAALGGDTQDRLSLPLLFKNQRMRLGPLELGRAPRWR